MPTKIFSTAQVSFPDEMGVKFVPPALIASLDVSSLRRHFEFFASFVYKAVVNNILPTAMYDAFIKKLVKKTNGVPDETKEDLYNKDGVRIQEQRLELVEAIGSQSVKNSSLQRIIVKTLEQIKNNGTELEAFYFQLYFYICLYHFVIWYCAEAFSTRIDNWVTMGGESITAHQMPASVQDYVKQIIQADLSQDGQIDVDGAFFTSTEYQSCFIIEAEFQRLAANTGLCAAASKNSSGYLYLRPRSKGGEPASKITAGAIGKLKLSLASSFQRALKNMIDSDQRSFLSTLYDDEPSQDYPLVTAYCGFSQYGVGDGSDTVAMFGKSNYGLLFVPYQFQLLGGQVSVTPNQEAFLLNSNEEKASACFLYYGLNGDYVDNEAPRIVFEAKDPSGKSYNLGEQYVLRANQYKEHRFSPSPPKLRPDAVAWADFSPTIKDGQSGSLTISLRTSNTQPGQEEMMYIVMKHKLVNPLKVQPSLSLATKWKLPNNEFTKNDLTEVFLGQDADLSSLVLALAGDASFEVYAAIVGHGIADIVNRQTGELKRADDQMDNHVPDVIATDNPERRKAVGQVYWYPDPSGMTGWLIFYIDAYVSPLVCTWNATNISNYNTLYSSIGQYLRDGAGNISYNCVLSSFRAMSLFEAMIQKIIMKTVDMYFDGSLDPTDAIAQAKRDNILDKLNKYLDNEAKATILLPSNNVLAVPDPITQIKSIVKITRAFVAAHAYSP